jgi:hypothetical protein
MPAFHQKNKGLTSPKSAQNIQVEAIQVNSNVKRSFGIIRCPDLTNGDFQLSILVQNEFFREDAMKMIAIIMLIIGATAANTLAAEEPSEERGKELFESVKLGTNGKSCVSCHPGGRKLEWAATYDDEKLAAIINACIGKALKGKPLPTDADSMKSILMYIKTFAGPGR